MSSNLDIIKVCEHSKQAFITRKAVAQNYADSCAKRFYKVKRRNEAISRAKLETEVKRRPQAYITEEQVKAIQAKEWLTLKEAALLWNVSPLTLRRWVLAGEDEVEEGGKEACF